MGRAMKKASMMAVVNAKNPVLLETMQLLVISREFQKDVFDIRKIIGLTKKLLPFEPSAQSMRANKMFSDKLTKLSDAYFLRPDVKSNSRKFKHLHQQGKITREQLDSKLTEIERGSPLNALKFGIVDILKKYKLPPSFEKVIEHYILYGDIATTSSNFIIFTNANSVGSRDVCIRITGLMTTRKRVRR